MATSDPAIAELVDQLADLDAALKKVETDSGKAKTSLGDFGRTAGTAVDPQVHAAAQQLVGLDYDLVAVSLHAPKAAEGVTKVGTAAEASATKTKTLNDSLSDASHAFNEAHQAATTILNTIAQVADGAIALAVEQGRLSASSAQMGLDFDAAAASAGKFADETSAMQAASAFAAREIRLSQAELNALARVAGHAAEVLGTTADEQMADLTDALISGRERGLAPYGSALQGVAGESHTLGERLRVLVQSSGDVAEATDNAADRMNRFRDAIDDAKRTIANAATNEFMRLNDLANTTASAADSTERWNRNLEAVGSTVGDVAAKALHGVGALLAGVGLIVAAAARATAAVGGIGRALPGMGGSTAAGAAARHLGQASPDGTASIDDLNAFFRDEVARLEAMAAESEGQRSAGAGSRDSVRGNGQMTAAQARDLAARGVDMSFTVPETSDMVFTEAEVRRGASQGRRGGAAQNDSANAARLDQQFAAARGAPVSADWAAAFLRELQHQAGQQTEARGGTIATRAEGIDLQARSREAQIGVGRGREGDFDPTSSAGQDTARRERITVLREQREALAQLLVQAEHEEQVARESGATQSEINELMRARIGIQTALAHSTTELTTATADNTSALSEMGGKLQEVAQGMASGFAEAAVAALDGAKSFDKAIGEMLRSTLKSVAQMAIVEALKNTALAIGHLASFNYAGAAAAAAAAGAWVLVGAAAGVAIAATRPSTASAGASSAGPSTSARADTGAARPDRERGGGGPLQLNINVSGAFFETRHEVLQGLARGVNEARLQGYLPGLEAAGANG